jgi:serine/threonine protein phosphatase PrpC
MAAIRMATLTDIGGSTENQDRSFVSEATGTLGVFDGHGVTGSLAAETVCALFAAGAAAAAAAAEPSALFAEAEAALPTATTDGGTTASLLRINRETGDILFAHVGDSEGRLFTDIGTEGIGLCADHTPLSVSEFERMNRTHGTPPSGFRFSGGSYRNVFMPTAEGGYRVSPLGGFTYCDVRNSWSAYVHSRGGRRLAVTRAIGDFDMKSTGVIAEPSVTTVTAGDKDKVKAIVVASDGFWDGMQYTDVSNIVCRPDLLLSLNAGAAVAELMEVGKRTNTALFGTETDNITVAVAYVSLASLASLA